MLRRVHANCQGVHKDELWPKKDKSNWRSGSKGLGLRKCGGIQGTSNPYEPGHTVAHERDCCIEPRTNGCRRLSPAPSNPHLSSHHLVLRRSVPPAGAWCHLILQTASGTRLSEGCKENGAEPERPNSSINLKRILIPQVTPRNAMAQYARCQHARHFRSSQH